MLALWQSVRLLVEGPEFETHQSCCIVSLSKKLYSLHFTGPNNYMTEQDKIVEFISPNQGLF